MTVDCVFTITINAGQEPFNYFVEVSGAGIEEKYAVGPNNSVSNLVAKICNRLQLDARETTTNKEIVVSEKTLIVYMDGIHDDTEALQDALDGKEVRWPDGRIFECSIEPLLELPKE